MITFTNMLTRPIALAAWGLAVGLLFAGCQSGFDKIEDWETPTPDQAAADIRQVQAPEGFDFATSKSSELTVEAIHPQTGEPMGNVGVSVYTHGADMEERKIASGVTGIDGRWTNTLNLAIDRDSITLRVNTMGFAGVHRIGIMPGAEARYVLGAEENSSGRIVEDDFVELEEDGATGTLGGRSTFAYQGGYNNQGRPNYLTDPMEIDDNLLEFIATNLSEQEQVPRDNPHYLDEENSGSVFFRQEGELWLAFAHEGAGYRNAVGYFTYPIDKPPSRVSDIDIRTVAFPNVSYRGSGGQLRVGDRVYIGKFPAGTAVGWFLVPNGWDRRRRVVNDRSTTRYSVDALNTFTSRENRKHCVLLANSARQQLVLGFEDLNRPSGDNDFNDAVFVIQPVPWDAVDVSRTPRVVLIGDDTDRDGILDEQDEFPEDGSRAFKGYAPGEDSYGTIAFEDMWPKTGDYDFNDLVVDYGYTEVVDANGLVKDLQMDLRIRAVGASQNHGFAVRLPIDPSLVESVTGQSLTNGYLELNSIGVEVGNSEAVIPLFDNSFALFNVNRGIINTDPTLAELTPGKLTITITFKTPVNRKLLGPAPYDVFMIRSQDRAREIHLAGYGPTDKADMSLFNTEADRSDLNAGHYYVDQNNLPWAMTTPDKFTYPIEKKRIDEVYTNFNEWATYGGTTKVSWYRNLSANVNPINGY